MSKVTVNNLANLQNDTTATSVININDTKLAAAFDNTLSRDGTSPNQMMANLDMNSNQILNLPVPASDASPVRKIDLTNVSQVTNLIHTASATSITIGTGAKTFVVPSGLGFFPGQYLLIQVATDTTKYMLGRVTSYTGTSLVMNIISTGGSGTSANWTIDISGPVGAPVATLNTVVNAIAATIDPSINTLTFAGYNSIGDGGTGTYFRVVTQPADTGKFQSADGSWWHLVSNVVSPEMFGCFGDSTTDDCGNMQNCFTFVASRGGGEVRLSANKNYRIVINAGTPNLGLTLSNGVTLVLNSSKLSLECNTPVYGLRILNRTRIYGPGTIATTVSTGLSAVLGATQDIYHAPICLGDAGSTAGTPISPSIYAEVSDWIINGVTITSVRNNGQGGLIAAIGGPNHGVISNNTFPDNSTIAIAIALDWGWYGVINSSDLNTSKTNFNAGTAYTTHPHQIVIENNYIGNMTMPYYTSPSTFGTHGIRCSGCYDMKIRNNDIESVNFAGIFITAGDVGWEFAPLNLKYNAMRNICVEGNNIKNAIGNCLGIYFDAFPDNVFAAVNASTYTQLYTYDGYNNNAIIQGNKIASISQSTAPGVQIGYTRGGYVADNWIQAFSNGIYAIANCKNVSIERNDIFFCGLGGIAVDDTSTLYVPQNTLVKHNFVHRNCTLGSTQGNIYIGSAQSTVVDANQIGGNDEDQSLYGIVVANTSNAAYTSVINNYVYEVKTGGSAYRILETVGNLTIWVFRDNRYVAGANTYLQGPSIMPVRREYSTSAPGVLITHAEAARGALTGDLTPTYGTWGIGSTILNIDSVNTGEKALVKCVASGTPGTWKTLVTLP